MRHICGKLLNEIRNRGSFRWRIATCEGAKALLDPRRITMIRVPVCSPTPLRCRCVCRGGLIVERVDVSEPASISSGIAERYATAIFEIAQESKSLAKLEGSVDALAEALDVSDDMRDMIASPVVS